MCLFASWAKLHEWHSELREVGGHVIKLEGLMRCVGREMVPHFQC